MLIRMAMTNRSREVASSPLAHPRCPAPLVILRCGFALLLCGGTAELPPFAPAYRLPAPGGAGCLGELPPTLDRPAGGCGRPGSPPFPPPAARPAPALGWPNSRCRILGDSPWPGPRCLGLPCAGPGPAAEAPAASAEALSPAADLPRTPFRSAAARPLAASPVDTGALTPWPATPILPPCLLPIPCRSPPPASIMASRPYGIGGSRQ